MNSSQSTPFAGFSFVLDAKTKKEAAVWYLLIGVFIVLTVVNVRETWALYISRPTRTSVKLSSATSDVYITNLTLKLRLSLAEFIEVPPIKLTGEYVKVEYFDKDIASPVLNGKIGSLYNFACMISHPDVPEDYLVNTMLYQQIMDLYGLYWQYKATDPSLIPPDLVVNDWLELLYFEATNFLDPQKYPTVQSHNLGDNNVWKKWVEESKELNTGLENISLDYVHEDAAIFNEYKLNKHLTDAFGPHLHKKYALFMLLEAMKTGADPRQNLFRQLKNHFSKPSAINLHQYRQMVDENSGDRSFVQNQLQTVHSFIGWGGDTDSFLKELNTTATQVWEWALLALSQLIHIQAPNSEMYLTDWTYDLRDSSLPAIFTFKLIVPQHTKNINVAFYSRLVQRFENVYQVVVKALIHPDMSLNDATGNNGHQQPQCNINGIVRVVFEQLYEFMLLSFFSQYKTALHTSLVIETGRGNNIVLDQPFHHYEMILKMSRQFAADIDGCHVGSYEECMKICILDLYQEHCECFPWYMRYMKPKAGAVCAQPCKAAEQQKTICSHHCDTLMRHPCKLPYYEIDHIHVTPDDLDKGPLNLHTLDQPVHPVFSFKIDVGERIYTIFKEEYSMPRNVFLSDLGGQLDLWMGVNVIGVIHLILYIIKQIVHSCNMNTKIRKLFGKENVIDKTNDDHMMKEDVPSFEENKDGLESELILFTNGPIVELENLISQALGLLEDENQHLRHEFLQKENC